MAAEMEAGRCHVCLVEDQKVTAFPYMPELLLKHLGILVYDKVLSCDACNKLLHLWDEFLDESRLNMQISHPTALHKYKQKMLGLGFATRHVAENALKPDPDPESASSLAEPLLPCLPGLKTEDTSSEEVRSIKEEVPTEQAQHVFDCSELFSKQDQEVQAEEPMQIELVPLSPSAGDVQDLDGYRSQSPPLTVTPALSEDTLQCRTHSTSQVMVQSLPVTVTTALQCHGHSPHLVVPESPLVLPSCQGKNYHSCPRCPELKFSQVQALLTHILEHHSEQSGDSQFSCILCHILCAGRNGLKTHLRSHFGNTFKFKCKFCKKLLSSKQKLTNHIKTEHEDRDYHPKTSIWKDVQVNQPRYPCCICGKILSSKSSLRSHLSKLHPSSPQRNNKKKFACHVCGNTFAKKQGLSSHIKHHDFDLVPEYSQISQNMVQNASKLDENLTEKILTLPENSTSSEITENLFETCSQPSLKLTIFKDSGTFACKIGEKEPPFEYTVDSIEIPVADIDLHIGEDNVSNTSDCEAAHLPELLCFFCNKVFLSKFAMRCHLTQSHIKTRHHLVYGAYNNNTIESHTVVASNIDSHTEVANNIESHTVVASNFVTHTNVSGIKPVDHIEIIELD